MLEKLASMEQSTGTKQVAEPVRPRRPTAKKAKFKAIVIHKDRSLIRESSLWGWLATHHLMEPTIMVLIMANAVWIGLEVELTDVGDEPADIFGQVNNLFCAAFTLEILMRFLAYRRRIDFFLDPEARLWNMFDLTLVLLMILETWVAPSIPDGEDEVDQIEGFSAFRLFRLLRLFRLARLIRSVPEMLTMVRSLLTAVRSVSITFLLAFGVLYVWSIIFTLWAREKDKASIEYEHFGTLPRSFLTFQQVLSFDDTFVLIRYVWRRSPVHGMLMLVYILIAAFTILNMLIGILLKVVAATNVKWRHRVMKEKVETVFESMDEDASGTITRLELKNPDSLSLLAVVGIDDRLLQSALEIIESHTDMVDLDDLLEVIFKLLHRPETIDVLLVQRKLDKLLQALLVQTSEGKYPWITARNEHQRHMATKCAVELERRALHVVSAATDCLGAPSEVQARLVDTGSRDALALELLRLEAAMSALKVHLGRLSLGIHGTGPAMPTLWHWQRVKTEVCQSLAGVLELVRTLLGGGRLTDFNYHPVPGIVPMPEPLPLLVEAGKLPAPPGRGPIAPADPATNLADGSMLLSSRSMHGGSMQLSTQLETGRFMRKLPEGLPKVALGVAESTNNILPGCLVQLRGLKTNHELNGQTGKAKRWHPEVGRWSIALDSGEEKFVAPWNLVVAQAPPKDIFAAFHHDSDSEIDEEMEESSVGSEDDGLTLATDSEQESEIAPPPVPAEFEMVVCK